MKPGLPPWARFNLSLPTGAFRVLAGAFILALPLLAACSAPEARAIATSPPPPATQAEGSTLQPVTKVPEQVSGQPPGVPVSSIADKDSGLRVKPKGLEGPSIPIRNGSRVNLGNGLVAEVFIDPYPTNRLTAWLDVYLTREPGGGAVTDAHAIILYDMWSMAHGPYTELTRGMGDGHYVFRLEYIMFGAWEQVVEIRLPSQEKVYELVIVIVAYP